MRAFLTYGSYRLLGALVSRLPPRIGYWMAGPAGWLLHRLSPGLKLVLSQNMRHVLGHEADESQVQAVVREAFVNIAKGHYDLFRVARLSASDIEDLVQVEGWEHMEQALAQGRGVIAVSAHFGNVDLVMQLSVIRGIPTTAPVWHLKPERLFRYTLGLRQSHGVKMIPTDEPMIGLFRALKRNEVIGLACDRDVTDSARVVDFFGSPTRLPDGPVRVALRTGAVMIPVFALRLPDNSFLVQIEPPLDLPQTGDPEADLLAGMKQVVAAMEHHIGQNPGQWLVAAPVWPID